MIFTSHLRAALRHHHQRRQMMRHHHVHQVLLRVRHHHRALLLLLLLLLVRVRHHHRALRPLLLLLLLQRVRHHHRTLRLLRLLCLTPTSTLLLATVIFLNVPLWSRIPTAVFYVDSHMCLLRRYPRPTWDRYLLPRSRSCRQPTSRSLLSRAYWHLTRREACICPSTASSTSRCATFTSSKRTTEIPSSS